MFDTAYGEAETVSTQPLPIKPDLPPSGEYPLAALSPAVMAATEAIVDLVQLPVAIAACSVLAAVSLAVQPYVDVQLPVGETVPTSLFFVTVAESGERKSSNDKRALAAVRARENELRYDWTDQQERYATAKAAYDAARKKATTGKASRSDIERALRDCGAEPRKPILPALLVDEPTMPALLKLFAEAMPSLGLFSDEGGTLIGGHAMNAENRIQTGAVLSKLWDGATIKRTRAGDDAIVTFLPGRRLAMHIMLQPGNSRKLFGDASLKDQGFLSRTLTCQPVSKKGVRMWRDPDANSEHDLEVFGTRIMRLMAGDMPMDPDTRELRPKRMHLAPEARALFIQWHDAVEGDLRKGGLFEPISGFAAKLPEHATRIAAVMSYFQNYRLTENVALEISADAMARGIEIAKFHAVEAMRLYGGGSADEDTENADAIIRWARERKLAAVSPRLLQRSGPQRLASPAMRRALQILLDERHLRPIEGGADITYNGKTERAREAYAVAPDDAA